MRLAISVQANAFTTKSPHSSTKAKQFVFVWVMGYTRLWVMVDGLFFYKTQTLLAYGFRLLAFSFFSKK